MNAMSTASAAASVMGAASKASNFASQTVQTARSEVLREPLGFIKIIQFVIAIITFAVACNGGESVSFNMMCSQQNGPTYYVYGSYNYPYDLGSTQWGYGGFCDISLVNETQSTIAQSGSTTSVVASSGFFVFTGVASFLYSLTFIIIYVFFKHKYDNNVFFSLIDFAFTVLWTIFWFCGSIAFSVAVNSIQTNTDPSNYIPLVVTCNTPGASCSSTSPYPTYATLIVACIFGFANVLLWGGDCWFVLKETAWFKNKYQVNSNQQQHMQNPQMSASTSNNKI